MKHALLVTALLVAFPCHSQDKARHEGYEALEGLVGVWTIPGQETTYEETCAWYHGARHIVCNTESRREDGTIGHSMSVLGFVPDQGYVYTGIGSGGRYETHEKGTLRNGVLEYVDQTDGVATRIRIGPFTDRNIVPFNVHTSRNGADWQLAESFNYVRVKGSASATDSQDECRLSVRPVMDGKPVLEAVIRPDHVSGITRTTDEPTGMQRWEVQLTPEGAAINRDFSRANVGRVVAIHCAEQEVARPLVAAPSSDSFAFTIAAES